MRGLPLARVQQLVDDNTDGRFLGLLGEPGVNIAKLNQALDDDRLPTLTPAPTHAGSKSLFSREILWPAIVASFAKLDPRVQVRNPVMFVVEVGALITTIAG